MGLQKYIEEKKQEQPILLMTHLVLGYPSFAENKKMIAAMSKAKVELVELQIPFSEPSADGPVLVAANAESLKNGTKVQECFDFAAEVSAEFPEIHFLFMTYYNIVFRKGIKEFIQTSKEIGIKGFILPDLPLEEAGPVLEECQKHGLDNIFIYTPTNTKERLETIATKAAGFIYCVGRRGVTGQTTSFDQSLTEQIDFYREAAGGLPLALGFGVKSKEDIDFLKGKSDIAVLGSKVIQLQQEGSVEEVESFLCSLRA